MTFFRNLAETRSYTLGIPVTPKLTPDGKSVIFLRSGPRDPVLRLYELDVASGKERELLTPEQILKSGEEKLSAEEKARRERQRQTLRGFTTFQLTEDGARVLVVLGGKLYVVNRADGSFAEMPGAGWIAPQLSPDGKFIGAVRGNELFVIDIAARTERQLTTGATEFLHHGVAEFVAQEELDRFDGFWWSPDSKSLVYQETDNTGVEARFIPDPLHPGGGAREEFLSAAGDGQRQGAAGPDRARGRQDAMDRVGSREIPVRRAGQLEAGQGAADDLRPRSRAAKLRAAGGRHRHRGDQGAPARKGSCVAECVP